MSGSNCKELVIEGFAATRDPARPMLYSIPEVVAVLDPACKHEHTRLIARDDESCFVECVGCGEIIESAGSKQPDASQVKRKRGDPPGFDESLSDA
jgi:Zn ribbon nucleic-acid-binding protein